jgi:FkbM family methyltransferase
LVLEAFCDSLPADATVVEAGAYHGEDTVRLAERCGFVHAFEPISFNELRVATEAVWLNVECWNYALGSETTEQEMWVSGGSHTAASSLLAPKGHLEILPAITFEERRRVKTITLADWVARNDPGPLDGLWLDLQGMELAVMQAAGPVLDTVRSIVLEASHTELYEGCPLWPEVRAWLEARCFKIVAEEDQGAGQMNVLVSRA